MTRNAEYWQRRLDDWQQHGQIEHLLPEVWALHGCHQPSEFHAEGDAYVHTMLAVNAIPATADERVFWAILLHDIGKASTTQYVDGRWRAHGHAQVAAEQVDAVLRRFYLEEISEDVAWLVRHHGFILDWGEPGLRLSVRQQRFCCHPLFSLLVTVCRADSAGSHGNSKKGDWLERVVALSRNK